MTPTEPGEVTGSPRTSRGEGCSCHLPVIGNFGNREQCNYDVIMMTDIICNDVASTTPTWYQARPQDIEPGDLGVTQTLVLDTHTSMGVYSIRGTGPDAGKTQNRPRESTKLNGTLPHHNMNYLM